MSGIASSSSQHKNYALIMMAGSGTRFGAAIPKQFVEVEGKPIFVYLAAAYESLDIVDGIVSVCHPEWIDYAVDCFRKEGISKIKRIVPGGSSRSQSVQLGLNALSSIASGNDVVLIHDVTHPFIDTEQVVECINAASEIGAATLVGSCFDTMYEVDSEGYISSILQRERVVSATAPECFRMDVVYPLFAGKSPEELEVMTSAGSMLAQNGRKVKVIRTPLINLKITLHEDMEAFKKLLHGYYYDLD